MEATKKEEGIRMADNEQAWRSALGLFIGWIEEAAPFSTVVLELKNK